ncbi:MAG: hypothetical protein J5698_00965 [Bacteroidaceae bacterium]|nr:hypothetical protein [Bacteroidaceae bacterium]
MQRKEKYEEGKNIFPFFIRRDVERKKLFSPSKICACASGLSALSRLVIGQWVNHSKKTSKTLPEGKKKPAPLKNRISRTNTKCTNYSNEHEFYGGSLSRKSFKNRFENLSKILNVVTPIRFSSCAFHFFPACHRSCKPGAALLERMTFAWTKAENESLSRRRLRKDCLLNRTIAIRQQGG